MSSSSVARQVLDVTQKYILYTNYIIFVTGLIGNIFNTLIFLKLKAFRSSRSAFYLIVESITSIIILIIYFFPQIFQVIYGTDPVNLSLFWCKTKATSAQLCRLVIGCAVCFEAFDQFLSTNHRVYLRQMNTMQFARCLAVAAAILCSFQTIPFIIFYDIVPSFGCIITNQALKEYYVFVYYIFLNGFLPILITSVFSLLAYRNVRNLVRRQISIERRRLDRQLTAMIFARIIVFVILLSISTIYRIYGLNVSPSPVGSLSYAINQLLTAIGGSLLLWICTLNFYIFLVTSARFRRQVKHFLLKRCWQSMRQWCKSNRNEIHPVGRTSTESGMELEG